MTARFLQLHTLTSYPASLLNRDDAGFAKRMPFGGGVRTRISSQCLKRHWRVYEGENSLQSIEAPDSIRSRISFDRYVAEPLIKEGVNAELARHVAQRLVGIVFGGEAKKEKAERQTAKGSKGKSGKAADAAPEVSEQTTAAVVQTPQVTVLGRPELDYLCQLAREAIKKGGSDKKVIDGAIEERTKNDKELKRNIAALKPGSLEAGLGAALFGRMVTGDILARTDAAIHVAHAMTVHAQMTESDYFSAIDDLVREEGEQASGHINSSELTSGLFYGYVVVDVDLLVKNLGDDRALAGDVVQRLVHIVATVSPGAKLGSTAPYAYSHLVIAESGKAQPRTLQNAFLEPVKTGGNVVHNAYDAVERHMAELDSMYGKNELRAHAGLDTAKHASSNGGSVERFENKLSLAKLATWSKEKVLA